MTADNIEDVPMNEVPSANPRTLLSIVELGGYPNFAPLYARAGFQVESATSMRKAVALLKTMAPAVIVAELNFQSDFRDRTSRLDTLLAVLQRMPDTRLIVFYEKEYCQQLERVSSRFPLHATFAYPIDAAMLEQCLLQL